MRKLTKKISMLMVLAMLVGLFSGVVSASAASKWSFKSAKYDVAVGSEINMKKNEYADFDLLKEGKALAGYTVTWESSDEDVVWVNAKSGQLRADKAKKAEDGDKAVITANIVNDTTKKTHKVSFTIVVGEVKVPVYTVNGGEDVTIKLGEEVKFAPVVKDEAGEVVKFATHKSYNGYFVDGKAIANPWTPEEAGEYNVVVAQFASKAAKTDLANALRQDEVKVVVKPAKAAIASYKQVALNAVEITLNDASFAEQILADNTLLKSYMVSGGNDITTYVKSIAAKKDVADTLVVTMFNNFSKDTTYKFTVDESTISFKGAESKPVRVEVVSKAIIEKTETAMAFKVYNELGTDITADITPLNGYTWKWNVPETNCFFDGNNKLYFFEAGKEVTVEFVLDLGYDTEGNKLGELKASGVYYSVPASTASNPEKYAIEKVGFNVNYTAWGTSLPVMADGDLGYYLVAQYTKTKADGSTESKYIFNGSPENGSAAQCFSYKSSNEAVMLIDEVSGALTPVAAGSAVLFIIDTATKNTVGAVNASVVGSRNLSVFTVAQESTMLSVGTSSVDGDFSDTIVFKPTSKDQLGAKYTLDYTNSAQVEFKIAYPLNKTFSDYFTVTNIDGNGKVVITPNQAALTTLVLPTKTQAFQIEVNAYQNKGTQWEIKKSAVIKFTVKNISTVNAATTALTLTTNNVDTKLDKDALWKYNSEVTLVSKDRDGFKLGLTGYTVITGASMASTATGAYSVLVLKNNGYAGADCGLTPNGAPIEKITFAGVTATAGVVSKMSGQYVIKLYKGDGTKAEPVTQQTLSFTDSTPKITAVVESDKLPSGWDADDVNDAIKFVRNGNVLDADSNNLITMSPITTDMYEAVGNKVYIKKLKVKVSAGEMNYGSLSGTFEEEVAVNTLFTIE